MDSGDSFGDVSKDDHGDESLLNYSRNSRKIDPNILTPKASRSIKLKSPGKTDSLTYQDFKSSNTNESAHVVENKLQFNVPIYQDAAFKTMPLRKQVQMLCAYHTHIARNIAKRARASFESAPLPKPILSSVKCSTSLRKDSEDDDDETPSSTDPFDALLDLPPEEEYISRSGRITKRKFYSETMIDMKKLKVNDEEWKNDTKSSPSTSKGTLRAKPDTNSKSSTLHKNLSKTNQEIISRSPLFRDKDRLAKIAEGVEQKTFKHKAEEKKVELFQSSLKIDEDYIEELLSDSSDSMTRTVVVPPKLGPKGRKGADSKTQKAKRTQRNESQKKPLVSNKDEPSSTKRMAKKMVACPICNREFETKDIEEHASSCGENVMPTRSHNSGPLNMACPNCDMVLLEAEDFEKHVGSCS